MKISNIDGMVAFALAQANKGGVGKVFDWDKAASIIKERKAERAMAGLAEDWFWTADVIYEDYKPFLDAGPYLASLWATPVIILDDDDEGIECWRRMDTCDWTSGTVWPRSALAKLKEE